jgi:hypothetical protein
MIFLEHIIEGGDAKNLTNVIMDALMNDGVLSKYDIVVKLLSFGIDGTIVFQVKFLFSLAFVFKV